MESVGTKPAHAKALGEVLISADYRGHFSHGLNRLDMYVNDIKSGTTVSDREPSIVKELGATAHVDGNNLLGPVVGNFCMDIAIQKAKDVGVGWVVAKGSNHYGIAGWYSMQALQYNLMGMSFTNTSPLQVPTRARDCVLGTNPITLAAPGNKGDSFVLDMATSTAAIGKVELHDRKGIDIPNGWGSDAKGLQTNNPKAVLEGGGLMPVGGSEESSGYKGYGLAMLVEIFCGLLGDAKYGPNIRKWRATGGYANLGQCFIAINPDAFAPGFSDRMQNMMDICRDLTPAEGQSEVFVAGDPERKHMAKVNTEGGIRYHPNLVHFMKTLAEKLQVAQMKTKS
ncbi:putative oxidoreductase YjmC [Glandiceps talaboti]